MYQLLIFFHVLGITILGGVLIFGQIHQVRARRSNDIRFIAETYRTLYLTIIPWAPIGGSTILLSGIGIIFLGGYPVRGWILALLLLFAFEMMEGITHYILICLISLVKTRLRRLPGGRSGHLLSGIN
jgi:uncharacterized membrane protein